MGMRAHAFLSRLLLLPLASAACGSAVRAAPVAQAPSPQPAPQPPAPASAAPEHAVARSAVRAVVSEGLGMFLRRVDIDDHPVFVGGKFHGFRIAGLRDPQFWNGVDIKPGDVVTSVNGFPIEHPEQAQTAFDSLEVASELRVVVEREGQPHELVYAIIDDR
jgi:type II secretion system protein C